MFAQNPMEGQGDFSPLILEVRDPREHGSRVLQADGTSRGLRSQLRGLQSSISLAEKKSQGSVVQSSSAILGAQAGCLQERLSSLACPSIVAEPKKRPKSSVEMK